MTLDFGNRSIKPMMKVSMPPALGPKSLVTNKIFSETAGSD
jgi:hypothetical protein